MMFCDLKEMLEKIEYTPNTSYYTGYQIEIAENSFKKYLEWKKQHTIKPITLEEPMVSEKYQFGGTIDFFGLIDNIPTLVDYKTCSTLFRAFCPSLCLSTITKRERIQSKELCDFKSGKSRDGRF